jgi:hypothetical protein
MNIVGVGRCEFCGTGPDCCVCGRNDGCVRAAIMPVVPSDRPPVEATDPGSNLPYRVWWYDSSAAVLPWRCVACFRHLRESLTFLEYCRRVDADAVFQSPAGCRRV